MNNISKNLEDQINLMKNKYKGVRKRKWMNRLSSLVFIVFSIFMYICLVTVGNTANERTRNTYLETTDYEALSALADDPELRSNPEVNNWYEEQCLGIGINVALAGISRNCNANTNYLNEIGNVQSCINKSGNMEVKVDESIVFTTDYQVSGIIESIDNIYCINMDDDSLHSYNVEKNEDSVLINENVVSFALYGDYIFYLTSDEQLNRFSLETLSNENVAKNVQRFYMTGDLIVQDSVDIYKIGITGDSPVKLISNSLLLGADSENIYFTNLGVTPESMNFEGRVFESKIEEDTTSIQNAQALYSLNLTTNVITLIGSYDDFIRAVYVIDGEVIVDNL